MNKIKVHIRTFALEILSSVNHESIGLGRSGKEDFDIVDILALTERQPRHRVDIELGHVSLGVDALIERECG